MQAKITFLGAARNVTGSRYLVDADGSRVLVDCGLYQERQFAERNWEAFPAAPSSINAVVLTHAHLDHCGYLPRLVRDGFRGKVICTEATADIAAIVLKDAANIQEEDVLAKQKRHAREGRKSPRPLAPLYTGEDVDRTLRLFSTTGYGKSVAVCPGVEAVFRDAGHILGSANVEMRIGTNGGSRRVVFSGDVGRWNRPILRDPEPVNDADYIVVESTYGNRLHEDACCIEDRFARIINETYAAGGNVVIPAFAIERAQEVLYHLNTLVRAGRIPAVPVFLDSPMAVSVTEVFEHHPYLFDEEMNALIKARKSPFDMPNVTYARTREQSKAINDLKESAVIMAGSGMCTAGRIKHHLAHNIMRAESTILFVGYQASGTLGGIIASGAKQVRVFGTFYPVRARVEKLEGMSAHADRDELAKWLSGMKRAPRRLFMTHGEPEAALAFADFVKRERGWPVSAPEYRDEAVLD